MKRYYIHLLIALHTSIKDVYSYSFYVAHVTLGIVGNTFVPLVSFDFILVHVLWQWFL